MTERSYTRKGSIPAADDGRLDIELTERCNNACIHCCINRPARDRRSRARELDTDTWKDILRHAAGMGVMTVRFTGGEPLLRDDFAELYVHARRLGLRVMLFTNARLITPRIAGLLADIPPLEAVEVSAYGMRKKSYEAVAGKSGSHAEFLRGVQCLLDRKIPFVVKGILLPPNKEEWDAFETWAASNPGMDGPPACTLFLDLRGRRDSAAGNNRIRRLRVSPGEVLRFLSRDADRFRKEAAEFFGTYSAPPGDRLFTCGIGPGCVDAYGFFQPCLSLRDPGLTFDLKRGTLKEAFASVYPPLKKRRAKNPLYLERCARCFLRGFCEQCPARSWSEHGTLDTPVEYLCRATHVQARFLGLLGEREAAWNVRDSGKRIRDLKRRTGVS